MEKPNIQDLLERYHRGECTAEEEVMLSLWFHKESISSKWEQNAIDDEMAKSMKQAIDASIDRHEQPKRLSWYKYAAAAAIVMISLGAALFFNYQKNQRASSLEYADSYISPGEDKAILTLADGKEISLNDASVGKLASQSGISITKSKTGQVIYTINKAITPVKDAKVEYNTITTPRGGQYVINLPDGTTVWLNAESSVKFPVSFINLDERHVELKGEAYFEVAPDKDRPFKVLSNQQVVEVFGTHFNVMAYANEANVETTLLEGKVSVTYQSKEKFIKPGQQVQLIAGEMKVLNNVDLEGTIAWKNKVFQFDNTDIDKVLRQIERWYNVDVQYAGPKPDVSFTGVIPMNVNVSKILRVMEQTCNVKFEIEGRNIKRIK
jgi:transmembrane sensor